MDIKADIIISGNAVFTGKGSKPGPASIIIKGSRIVKVLENFNYQKYEDIHTKHFHFDNELIVSGFHDFHIHLLLGSMLEKSVRLHNSRSAKDAARLVGQFAKEHPDAPFILGSGWDHLAWDGKEEPHKKYLDEAVSDRPVLLYQAEFHSAWVNTKALELAGVNEQTNDPAFGKVVKSEDGVPTGLLIEHAVGLVGNALPFSDEMKSNLLKQFLKEAAKHGVTSVHDLLRLPDMSTEEAELYDTFERKGELTARIHFAAPLTGDLTEARKLREKYQSELVRFSGLKQFIDGVTTSHTAYLLEPYSDRPGFKGDPVFSEQLIKQWTAEADREGFRVRFHAIGDAAVRLALDAFELAQKENGKRDSRHSIEHVEMIHPDDIIRFKQLGVLASIQPEHLNGSSTEVFEGLIGPERMHYNSLQKTLMDQGAIIVFGTDYPIVGLNPLTGIYRAVTRTDDNNVVWDENEKISLAEAIRAYTYAPAFASFREHELGTIEEGKLADLAVIDRNLFAVNDNEIKEAKVIMTLFDGKVVHDKRKNF